MYLKKIVKLQNIGKFHRPSINGGEYGKFTLFYAGNGRGKTTICAVLRSLKTGNAALIEDRKTLGESSSPEAQLLLDSGVAAYAKGKWNNAVDAMHIFDGTFVTDNVHVGEEVSTDNRRSLYRIIIGSKGVKLAEEIDALDAQITAITSQISTEKKALQQHVSSGLTFEQFLSLAEDSDIEKKISAQQGKIKAANQAAEIAAKPLMQAQDIPGLPASFLSALEKTIENVSANAAEKLEAHLTKHQFDDDGESWVATGLQYVHDDLCPFCATSVKGNSLVEAYRSFFDEAYKTFMDSLIELHDNIVLSLSEAAALKSKARFVDLASQVEFWRTFGTVDFTAAPSLDVMVACIAALYSEAKAAIEAKIAAPLEKIDTTKLNNANNHWTAIVSELDSCNTSLTVANIGIQAIKDATNSVNKSALEKALRELEAVKTRHASNVKAIADGYSTLVTDKAKLVAEKHQKKGELDAYDSAVLPKYHDAINGFLGRFGAGFSLMKSEKNYVGKVPQWMYTIEINKHAVDITKKPGQGEASFQTAMSAGDRNTLALALFLSQLELDPALKDAVVVFDDPFTSLDEFRRVMTAKTIFRIGQNASQVIVLSHDKHFLNDVFGKIFGAKCETFQISSIKANSSIEPWDLEREVKEGYLQYHMDMKDFHDGHAGDAKAMRTLMRPLLEKYIRYRFPNQIPDGKWLGEMLAIIAADPNHPLTPLYQDIDDINQFTAPYHHDTNTAFDEDEVKTFVGRTLAIVGGC
jgi:wobble nucleotide-excising tRNase